ncbi:T9SS type A sorting domain-containing protein [Cytophagaceae bacterium ABcell3]|nr:T9SS type A sorting domain-containing protein [Cytophagaceae bacterium ABcell3]
MKHLIIIIFILFAAKTYGQFAPQAGEPGTTAIHRDSSVFVGWATGCTVVRGPQDISDPSLGNASAGEPIFATGKSGEHSTVSLGDGGLAIVTFATTIKNGEGPDFAVFENAFRSEGHAFLELAFVEVSSDGENYFRFPSISLTDPSEQVGTFGVIDASKVHNLAGKYVNNYGTPFDLEDLKDEEGLDVDHITHVRVIDVVGSIDPEFATYDSEGNIINDPWPTPFPSSGFDLEAVGVINAGEPTSIINSTKKAPFVTYPNPVIQGESVTIEYKPKNLNGAQVEVSDMYGRNLLSYNISSEQTLLPTHHLSSGAYLVKINDEGKIHTQKLLITK